MEKWRLLTTGYTDGFQNMAIDEAILIACKRGLVPPTVRFYGWSPPALSLGYLQKVEGRIDLKACRRLGIDVVRRPTGGGAVLHDQELTYSLVCPEDHPLFPPDVLGTYKVISSWLIEGFRSLGLEAQLVSFREKQPSIGEPQARRAPAVCFSASSWYEIAIQGRKVCGSAQRRIPGAFLQHGSILLDFDPEKLSQLFIPKAGGRERMLAKLHRSVTSLNEHLEERIDFFGLQKVLAESFRSRLNVELVEGKLTSEEQVLADEHLKERYLDENWNLEVNIQGQTSKGGCHGVSRGFEV